MSKEMLGGCCVCSDDRGWPENPLVYCDGANCNVAVHQACYGIVTVPSGPWFCRKCELHERPRCELCPSKEGAFKKTDQNSWAHVVCALYIPEVRFGNVTTMEPILISLIPQERFNKTCYICEENNRGLGKANFGACMQCNKAGCRSTFHVTCAQMLGLLCEEAGNMLDNVKYCGYCQHHYGKLKATRHVKIIPPYRPVPSNNSRSVSPAVSTEKSTHGGQGGKSSSSSNNSGEDGKSSSNNNTSSSGSGSGGGNQSSTSTSDGGGGGKSNNNISPDINSSCSSKTNQKNGKKGSSYHGSSGGKSSNSLLDKSGGGSGGGGATASNTTHEKSDGKGKGHGHSSKNSDNSDRDRDHHQSVRCEDNLTVKLERLEDKGKGSFPPKKDFSTIQLKEVVTAALDRPITNTSGASSKFDALSQGLTSGLEGPSSIASAASSSGRHHSTKISLPVPDIKPDVTLTPIPMKSSSSHPTPSRHSSSKEEEHPERERDNANMSKSAPGANLQFHSSNFGAPPKLQNQQASPDISEAMSKGNKPPELTAQEDLPSLDKSSSGGPPSKRARGMSRDDEREREQRRTPTKGRGGRRGSTTTGSSYSRREVPPATTNVSAVTFIDDSSFDEVIEANGSTNGSTESSSRGGRQSGGRKPGSVTRSSANANSNVNTTLNTTTPIKTAERTEDPPAPTLSQLKQSGQLGGTGSDTPPPGLAPHMFGNALNPSSSMAMKMVDTLSEEMEAVAAAGNVTEVVPAPTSLVGIPLPGANKPPVNSTSSSNSSSSSATAPPQTLEQLLERQWEQGSQFLMEQAQHLDIAQLLSCLNQLKQDNKALEEHVQSLIQRRDQLTAINARLSIPLGNSSSLIGNNNSFSGGGSGSAGSNNSTHSNHNGFGVNQSTPSPNVHPSHTGPGPNSGSSTGSKNFPVGGGNNPPSQNQNEHHGRERNSFMSSELSGGRAELVVTHSSQGGPMHSSHQQHNGPQRSHYGFNPHPVVTSLSSPHPPPHSNRDRDGR